jgi:diaminobutyrate-2-oxoglutarate transaminase
MHKTSGMPSDVHLFEEHESAVRLYSRKFPVVFDRSKGAWLYTADGDRYLDFFCGAGALNYGHNQDTVKRALIDYLERDGLLHALDMHTTVKRGFIEGFQRIVLEPRGLSYRLQFPGPTGTDAVEAALKLARLVTGRRTVISFTGAFHGMSSGSLGVTGDRYARSAGRLAGQDVVFVPYENSPFGTFDSIEYLRRLIVDPASGVEVPAAIIVEPVQIEGGVYLASVEWLCNLRELSAEHGILLIFDDIQAGCGRTGDFFSFEHARIKPDLITLSKSIGGCGLPLSLVLISPEFDIWEPGQHTGTFRGNQLALLAGRVALDAWLSSEFTSHLGIVSALLAEFGTEITQRHPELHVRGRGMLLGIDVTALGENQADSITSDCFQAGLVLEQCGRNDSVIKLMPPLTISISELEGGLKILGEALEDAATRVQNQRG